MATKKKPIDVLKEICLQDNIDNISFQENFFTVKFGDVVNTNSKTGIVYTLLDTYIQMPYTFGAGEFKLHRGIVNEFETTRGRDYKYSGFTHYNGTQFCYGESGIERCCAVINTNGVNSDNFNMLLIKLKVFLSVSSHGTTGAYRTIETRTDTRRKRKLTAIVEKNGVKYPSIIEEKNINIVETVDYSKPYKKVIKEVPEKQFIYNNETIIPKVVQHEHTKIENIITREIKVSQPQLKKYIEEQHIKKFENEIGNKPSISLQNLLHKLPDQQRGMDGCVYI